MTKDEMMKTMETLVNPAIAQNTKGVSMVLNALPEGYKQLACLNICGLMVMAIPVMGKEFGMSNKEVEHYSNIVMDIGDKWMKFEPTSDAAINKEEK